MTGEVGREVEPPATLREARLDVAPVGDPAVLSDRLDRLGDLALTDHQATIRAARELVESTATFVLASRAADPATGENLQSLMAQAQQSLALSAKDVTGEAPELRRIISALAALAQGVTEIDDLSDTIDGQERPPGWLRPQHARLITGAAQLWCRLMLDTFSDPDAAWRSATPRA